MVCGEADAACPFVKGAALRVSMPYLDPKIYDGGALRGGQVRRAAGRHRPADAVGDDAGAAAGRAGEDPRRRRLVDEGRPRPLDTGIRSGSNGCQR